MRYTLYWILLVLGVILISLVMEGKPEINVIVACFIWGVITSIIFDMNNKPKGKKK